MTQTQTLVKCPSCGTTNRLPPEQPGRTAVCGKCKAPLDRARAATPRPVTVTDASFANEVGRSPLPVLLDLWADWCGPCHMLAPTVEQLAIELSGKVKVAKLDIDANPQTASRFGVQSIPTLLVLKDGREVGRLVGVRPKEEILRTVKSLVLGP